MCTSCKSFKLLKILVTLLLQKMLSKNPNDRPSTTELMENKSL